MTAWLAHLYTASGAVLGFIAVNRIYYDRYAEAFWWLAGAVFIDATDGAVARHFDVARRLPHFDGARLDDIVDYLTYVFVPAVFVWHALLVPDQLAVPVAAAMLLSSAYGFNRTDAKTTDHFFTGFPSYWNIVVFYLFLMAMAPAINAAILLACAVLVFVPIRYVYPSRTRPLRAVTLTLGALWGVLMVVLLWQAPDPSPAVLAASLVFPAYYVAASLYLNLKVTTDK